MFIILTGVLLAGILLGVLIISLSFLAQEAEEARDFSGLDPDLPLVPDNYHGAGLLRLERLS